MEVRFVTEDNVFVEEGIVTQVVQHSEGTVVFLDNRPEDWDELEEWHYATILLLPTTPVPDIGNSFRVECKLDRDALEWYFKEAL